MHGPESASNTCLGNVVLKEGFSANQTHQTASNSNILNVYKPIGLEEACGDINNLPSLKAGMKVSNRKDIDEKGKGFSNIERVFRKGVLGSLQLLLEEVLKYHQWQELLVDTK